MKAVIRYFSGTGNTRYIAEAFSLIARSMGRKLTSFHDECINCGRCIKSCPQKNIVKRAGGGVVFNGKCMLCTRCFHGCPVNAIGYEDVKYEQYRGREDLIGRFAGSNK